MRATWFKHTVQLRNLESLDDMSLSGLRYSKGQSHHPDFGPMMKATTSGWPMIPIYIIHQSFLDRFGHPPIKSFDCITSTQKHLADQAKKIKISIRYKVLHP
ncbi:hypothetical protein O181_080640 [Austropuccinia psidii MF-1]|uniref:Uncharacterized protein n=1 Tax=Austropuccinia psidii MF-1 TaxID=1389203 RepID=A0A9Q3IJ36_9BASI|nr:hypothetical protein [Austropuccinia psidii MF-1]